MQKLAQVFEPLTPLIRNQDEVPDFHLAQPFEEKETNVDYKDLGPRIGDNS